MSGIVLQARAFKITNKGGGTMRRLVPVEGDGSKKEIQEKFDTGSDYVHFICPLPKCGHRNKQSMYESLNYHDPANDRIPFKCRRCRTVVEVTRPYEPSRIITLDAPKPTGQRGNIIVSR